jgi:hypothetical protein
MVVASGSREPEIVDMRAICGVVVGLSVCDHQSIESHASIWRPPCFVDVHQNVGVLITRSGGVVL